MQICIPLAQRALIARLSDTVARNIQPKAATGHAPKENDHTLVIHQRVVWHENWSNTGVLLVKANDGKSLIVKHLMPFFN
jgi:hypothetical protein